MAMKRKQILLLGNSFSDDLGMYVPDFAREKKIPIHLEIIGYPGGKIDQHIDFISNNKPVYVYRRYNEKNKGLGRNFPSYRKRNN